MNSFAQNINYIAGLDNVYGSKVELYKNNLSLKNVEHDIELKFSYYNNDDKKIHSIIHSEPGVLVGGINDVLLAFKSTIESSISGSEFTCTVSSGVQNFVVNNVVMISIAINSNNDTYKAYELELKATTAGTVTYDVFGEVCDALKILPSLAMITSSDINAITKVYEIQDEVMTVSDNITIVTTLSDSIANVNITGTNIDNVNTVSSNIADVNTVSTHISNVDTVSQSITDVNTVSSSIVDVGIASANIASINTVANVQNLADIIRVADDLNLLDVNGIADITIVANDLVLGVDSNIITVSESISNVNIVKNNIDNVNAVGTSITDVVTVSTNISNVNITATDIASVNTVSSNIADVNTVSDGIVNVNTVSDSITNVNTVATNIVGLNSIVSNMAEILSADDNAAIATSKASEASDSAAAALQSSIDAEASAVIATNHIADKNNPHEVTKSQIGLGLVDNTADIDKVVASSGKLTNSVTIGGVVFDGSANIDLPGVNTEGNQNTTGSSAKWTNSRTITLSGDFAGSVDIDGSADVEMNVTVSNYAGHTHQFSSITNTPTTLAGYGITDAYTKTEVQETLPAIGLDTTNTIAPTRAGQFKWNQDEGTADLNIGTVTLQIGQEQVIKVRSDHASPILNGTVVMATGTIGNSGRILVKPYTGTKALAKSVVGVLTESISVGADGFVTTFGKVRNIDTTGTAVGETWVDGDILYPKPNDSGSLTKIAPTSSEVYMPIAIVIHAHSNGTLFIRASGIDENRVFDTVYTKSEIDTILGDISAALDTINGEVI